MLAAMNVHGGSMTHGPTYAIMQLHWGPGGLFGDHIQEP